MGQHGACTGRRSRRPRRGLRITPMAGTVTDAPPQDGRMSLMEHLIELRTPLIRCAIAIAIGACLGWVLYNTVSNFLHHPLEELAKTPNINDKNIVLGPLDGFMLRIKMST